MKIAMDMDNTIADEFGATLRPGMEGFIEYLGKRHELYVWTNSRKARAFDILDHLGLRKAFLGIIAREDYDPEDLGKRKDIGARGFDVLIDDDPEEVAFAARSRRTGILVKPYRKGGAVDPGELGAIIRKYKL